MKNFLLVAKYCKLLNQIKSCFKNKYNIKDFRKAKTINEQQIMQNQDVSTLKIDQLAFIYDLLEEKNLINCNSINILMKNESFIEMFKNNNVKTCLYDFDYIDVTYKSI